MKIVYLLILILTPALNSFAQKVANYSFGKFGTAEYEEFSFWVKAGKGSDIDYTYGKYARQVRVVFCGRGILNDKPCLKVRFTNNHILYIIRAGKTITVADSPGRYKKTFSWTYEGPKDGIGTFCQPCAENEDEAMKLVQTYFMK